MLSVGQLLAFFLISLVASTIGAITGIGGGVMIKPAMDAFHVLSVDTISFLSGVTVLSMSCYNVVRSLRSGNGQLQIPIALPLGIGAALGGVAGKQMFNHLLRLAGDANLVGAIQSACLIAITALTLVYTCLSNSIRTRRVRNGTGICLIGVLLGVLSAFLGIGGGPLNLVVLSYFFSMKIKEAAQNSLMVIMLSQIASLITTVLSASVPEFPPVLLVLLVCGGILGGILGRIANRRLDVRRIDALYRLTMVVIILISAYNLFAYL